MVSRIRSRGTGKTRGSDRGVDLHLSTFLHVRVRIRCPHCPRRQGDLSLARLAERFGAEAEMAAVLYELTRSCKEQVFSHGEFPIARRGSATLTMAYGLIRRLMLPELPPVRWPSLCRSRN